MKDQQIGELIDDGTRGVIMTIKTKDSTGTTVELTISDEKDGGAHVQISRVKDARNFSIESVRLSPMERRALKAAL